ncbi:RNase H domain-containing protein [Trichonephila clavipes]|nr:RNase H domain-containing protein [Trichonephila clavipes]
MILGSWEPSHVNVCFNEITNSLAREGSSKDSTLGGCLTFSEIATRVKQDISSSWKQASVDVWYEGNCLGSALLGTDKRRDGTTLVSGSFRSAHFGP